MQTTSMLRFSLGNRRYLGDPRAPMTDDVKVGDVALFHGRLVEVVETKDHDGRQEAYVVEHTDAGGIKWRFKLNGPDGVVLLATPKELVLDAIVAATEEKDDYHRLKLRTEKWFADPKVGDTFHEMFSHWVTVDEVHEDGRITIRYTTGFREKEGWLWDKKTYASREEFRTAYHYKDVPGYSVLAKSSKREAETR